MIFFARFFFASGDSFGMAFADDKKPEIQNGEECDIGEEYPWATPVPSVKAVRGYGPQKRRREKVLGVQGNVV